MDIERLLDTDSQQASTQTEHVDSPNSEHDSENTPEDGSQGRIISIPDLVNHCYTVTATGEGKKKTALCLKFS